MPFEPFDMTDEQKQALKACLAHWEENANLSAGKSRRFGSNDCKCCHEWLNADEGDCAGCPIARFTGMPFCYATPYRDGNIGMRSPIEKFREASQREHNFLRALLEERFEEAHDLCAPYKGLRWI